MIRGFIIASLLLISSAIQAKTTQIYPVSAGVKESIGEIGELTRQTESKLESSDKKLKIQMKLYKESGCSAQGANEDAGCKKQLSQMKETSAQMLDALSEQIPLINTKVKKVVGMMKSNISTYAKKNSLKDLWNDVNVDSSQTPKRKYRVRKGSMSSIFTKLYNNLTKHKGKSQVKAGLFTYDEMAYVSGVLDDLETALPSIKLALEEEIQYGNMDDFSETLGESFAFMWGDDEGLLEDDTELTDDSTAQDGADAAWFN